MNSAEQQAAFSNAEYLRSLEKSFAFERASSVIEIHCLVVELADEDQDGWYDLDSADMDISQEVEYLDSRKLLLHHPDYRSWVILCDEDEPCETKLVDAYQELT